MKPLHPRKRSRSLDSTSSQVPTIWRIVWSKDDYLSGCLFATLLLWAIIVWAAIEIWKQGRKYDEVSLAFGLGVTAILFTATFLALFVYRLRFVRRLFVSGHRVQAQIRQIVPDEHQMLRSRLLSPNVVVHCTYRVAGDDYSTTFTLPKQVVSEFGKAIWLRVDAAQPQRAVIEDFYL